VLLILFTEAEEKIDEWNSKTQDGFGVWAIVPKEGEFSGITLLVHYHLY
jgi:hypothetical protein